ncbi:sulfotransferase domain-containing protein [Rhodopirellula sp. MGV]|uniref:sulfotransferase domain-containing protein n=1 Tax=Rhodopirellula sp. MGV TaxID=2023130 RepID=UPI000B971066|nr:sulfotransferase domain-containing protein [Rhodopirellula sp. MGV]OYP33009.1 hypothetical protein CGZ80_19160 [Rhodopirellula sp. MGV]PNY35331.1 sulfotransferase [Rhodopirellula baltica]
MVTSAKPNLFVIGAMKSATSSLHDYLNAHPDIYMSSVKEPCHFVPELGRTKGLEWYMSLFEDGADAVIRGESSVVYTHMPDHPGVADRIAAFAPDARFIYVMRDPVQRAVSHYWHRVRSHRVEENRSPLDAFREENCYLDYSDYALQLEPYLDRFGRDRVHVLTMESMRDNPLAAVSESIRFLGLAPEKLPTAAVQSRRHETPGVVTKKIGWLHRFRHGPLWNRIGPMFPKSIRKMGRKVSEPVAIDRSSVDMTEAIAYAQSQLLPRLERLDTLVQIDQSVWTTLHSCAPAPTSASSHPSV